MIRNYKFRLYPNFEQQKKLHDNLTACRWVYNKMIERIHKEGLQTRNDLNYFLTELKESESWLYSYHSKMLQMISTQVAGAQKTLKEMHKKGYKTGQLRFARFDNFLTNILQKGLEILRSELLQSVRTVIPQELREVTPVEILMRSRKQEETIVQIQ